jgi:hypothetical protein
LLWFPPTASGDFFREARLTFFQRPIPPRSEEDEKILAEAKARIKEEHDRIEREKRLYQVMVEDPLDFDTLVRIGKRVGADMLEVTNKQGSIVRFYFKTGEIETTTIEAERATKAGVW